MTVNPVDLTGKKILITGPTGQVALPVVERLAQTSQVYALARFSKEEDRQRIEALGATTIKADLADAASLQAVPDDLDYVLNFAVAKTGDFDYDLAANAEGVGNLMTRCSKVKAFLHFSSTAVYEYAGHEPRSEDAMTADIAQARARCERLFAEALRPVASELRLVDLDELLAELGRQG